MRASTRRGQGPKELRDVAAGIRLDRDVPHMLRLIDRARTWLVWVDLVMRGTDEIVTARLRPRRRAMLPGGMPPKVGSYAAAQDRSTRLCLAGPGRGVVPALASRRSFATGGFGRPPQDHPAGAAPPRHCGTYRSLPSWHFALPPSCHHDGINTQGCMILDEAEQAPPS